jgi:hypothetical protein
MEAAILRVLILGKARRTHGEPAHSGHGPVIGNVLNDGVSGTAVRAVDEWIPVTAVAGIMELSQAIFAHAHIRGDEGGAGVTGPALPNIEP